MSSQKWWSDAGWVLFFIALFAFLKLCVVGFFLLPSSSMEPTLLPGDRVFVHKLAYGFTPPFFSHPLLTWSQPKRGDVIVFSKTIQGEEQLFIKRVIGLPGDQISFEKGLVRINQTTVALTPNQSMGSPVNNAFDEGTQPFFEGNHTILLSKTPSRTFFESRRFLVPPGMVFVLGDNRDNSTDSRQYGYVTLSQILGKANFVIFSTTGNSWKPEFRTHRFGETAGLSK
jgi:signal peptidase I